MGLDFKSKRLGISLRDLTTVKLETLPDSRAYRALLAEAILDPIGTYSVDLPALDDPLHSGTHPALQSIQAQLHTKPSPLTWRIASTMGDEIVLIALLALVLFLAPPLHLVIKVSSYEFEIWHSKLAWGLFALISWNVIAPITQTQDFTYLSNRFRSLLSIQLTLVLTVLSWIGLTYLFSSAQFTSYIGIPCIFLAIAAPAFGIWRIILADYSKTPRFLPRAIIVGNTDAGEIIAKELYTMKQPSINILGYIGLQTDVMGNESIPVLGKKNTLHRLIQGGMIDMIIMAIDHTTQPALFREAIEAAQFGISIVPMAVIYEATCGKIPVEHIGDQWYLSLPVHPATSVFYLLWKRTVDITFGVLGTLMLTLVLPVLALVIYLDSPGPIFYSQERLGHRGRKFRFLKFRSMSNNPEINPDATADVAIWAEKSGDTRITRVGHFLRTTHLDELPQVLNILIGNMSLIGPRPEREGFVSKLEKSVPFYRCRLSAKPGLTGWAQVKYPYGNSEYDALVKLQYDLYYIKHQSFTLDIFIMLKTAAEMLLCRGS
jgi:exopolysaccharide biosynthesis polyprenyl glycosylphosphotransferase